jgi:glycosyltransferase involved in cell wall biosynthesis
MKSRLIIWQVVTSHPTASFVKALAADSALEVIVFYEMEFGADRVNLGWQSPDHGQANTVLLPAAFSKEQIANILIQEKESLHIFCGTQRSGKVGAALRLAMERGLQFGVMSEPPVNQSEGLRRILKEVYLWTLAFRHRPIARVCRFLLAITSPRDSTFQHLGWPSEKIFPFGYFSPSPIQGKSIIRPPSGVPHLIYLGQFARHKGLMVLIEALKMLKHCDVPFRCSIFGDGPLRQELDGFVATSGLQDSVTLRGAIPHSEVARLLSEGDIYIAPGLVEPWGLTVNEAIQAGLPIIVSRGVRGGSELVEIAGCGLVVPPGDAVALAKALNTLICSPLERERLGGRGLDFAPCLAPEAAAQHLLDVVKYTQGNLLTRPVAPWWLQDFRTKDGWYSTCP